MKNNESANITLNFSDCEYLGEVHKQIQEKLELPSWYGGNLDALWDALTGIMHTPANISIVFKPKKQSAVALSDEISKIINVFEEAKEEYLEFNLTIDM